MRPQNPAQKKPESPWSNLGLNIFFPVLIMVKGETIGDSLGMSLSPTVILGTALLFPLGYGMRDFAVRKKANFYSILGFGSILMTGGVGLLKLDKDWIAIKEAAVPLLIGIAVLVTSKTRRPLMKMLFFNERIFDVPKIEYALCKNQTVKQFDRLMFRATIVLASSFLMSASLNYAVARYFIRSETGTAAFNEELGRMTAWSWVIIAVPCLLVVAILLWHVLNGIQKFTGLTLDQILGDAHSNERSDPKLKTPRSGISDGGDDSGTVL